MAETLLSLQPAFLPKEKPTISSSAKIPLDFAICQEGLSCVLFGFRGISAQLYTGTELLDPSLIRGARRGIRINDREVLFSSNGNNVEGVINHLSQQYAQRKGLLFVPLNLNKYDGETLDDFFMNQRRARVLMSQGYTYNYYGAPKHFDHYSGHFKNINEVWIGADIECESRASRGAVCGNVAETLTRAAYFLRK